MVRLKDYLKHHLLPKRLYLAISAQRKYKRAEKKHEQELYLLPFLVDKEKNAIDVGANKGLYTYFLAKHASHVYAYEPLLELASFLDKATDHHVTVKPMALSDEAGETTLYIPSHHQKTSFDMSTLDPQQLNTDDYQMRTITTTTLDQEERSNIGFIKIDVEGFELSVLKGAYDTIKRDKPILLVEILDLQADFQSNEVIQWLKKLDYVPFLFQGGLLKPLSANNVSKVGRNILFFPIEDK